MEDRTRTAPNFSGFYIGLIVGVVLTHLSWLIGLVIAIGNGTFK